MGQPKDELTRMRDRISELERMVEGLKGTVKALVESEEETWQLFEEAPLAYHSLDSKGRILKVNRAWTDMFGYSRGDVLGKWFVNFLKPEDAKHFKKRFEQFKREGSTQDAEFEVRRKDGSYLSVSFDGRIAYDDRARFRHTHCIIHDVSARKVAEQRLTAERAKLERALDCSADFVVIVDLNGNIKSANQAFVKATGFRSEEVVGRRFTRVLARYDILRALEIFRNDVLQKGSASAYEMVVVAKDESELNVLGSATVMRDEQGVPTEVLFIGKDITESIRTQKALRESEDKLRALFESSPESITILGLDGTILARNKATEDISGLSSKELIGKSFRELGVLLEDALPEYGAILARLQQDEKLGPVEGRIARQDGEIRWIEVFASPLKTGDETYAIQATTRDITERKRLEMLNTTLRDLGLALSTVSGLEDGLRLCIEAVLKVSAMDCGGIYLLSEVSGALDLAYHHGFSPEFVQAVSHHDADSSNTTLVVAGKAVYTEHLELGIPLGSVQMAEGLRAIAVLPISCEDRVIGCINVASHSIEQVPAWSRTSLEAIATEIGSAIMRLRAEQALDRSEDRYKTLLEISPDVIIAHCEGKIVLANKAAAQLLGAAGSRELVGRDVREFVHPEFRDQVSRRIDQVVVRRTAVSLLEQKIVRLDGEPLDVEVATVPFTYKGEPAALMVARDITERKRAEEVLREREARFRGVFDNASHGMALVDRDGKLLLANDISQAMLGYEPGELIGKRVMDLTHPDDLEKSRADLRMLLESKVDSYRIEKRYVRKDGTVIWVDLSVRPLRAGTGEIESVLGILVDITERKRAEEALRRGEEQIRRYSEDLEDMVRERTIRIHELEHQRAESEKLAATGRMAARIAHEINNPLGGIKNSFLLLKDIMDKNHSHYAYAERVEGEIDRIAGIVRRMFDFYKPGRTGDAEVSISKTISDVVAILESTSRAVEVALSLDVPEEPITAMLPGGYINQIMFNLVRNAIEASEAGTAVEVSAVVEGDTAVIRVRDEGQGIPDEIADRVFEPFFTTKDMTGINGLGLGLSVSKGMVELMGGSIAFDSASDKGTTFTVTLPITKPTEEV